MIALALIDHKTSTIYIQGVKTKLVPRYFDTPLKIIKTAKNGLPQGKLLKITEMAKKAPKVLTTYVNSWKPNIFYSFCHAKLSRPSPT